MAFKMGEKPKAKAPTTLPVDPTLPDSIVEDEEVDPTAHLNGALARGASVGATEAPPEQPSTPATPAPGTVNMADFAAMIGQQVAAGIAATQPAKRETFGQYLKRVNKGRSKLRRLSWENGVLLSESVLSNREIDLLNAISHTGRYVNRMVEVIVREDGADEVVEIRWNMKRDARFELKSEAKNFCAILEQVATAQAEERELAEEKDERAAARRRQRNA